MVPSCAKREQRSVAIKLPFEFTLGGAIMIGLIAIVGFSAWNTGNNLLFLVFSFLIAAMIVGFVAGSISLIGLEVKMRFPETIFAGEKTPVLVSLHNRKRWFTSNSVVAEVRGTYRNESSAAPELRNLLPAFIAERLSKPPIVRRTLEYFVYVARNHAAETKTYHIFENRGRLLIKDFELSTKYPFAFFRHRRRLPARETELIVLPKLEPYVPESNEMNVDAGKLVANKRGSGQELLALRAYRVNDDMRRVDWKATARTNEIVVREFSAEDDKKITIYLDPRVPQNRKSKITLRAKLEASKPDRRSAFRRFERGISPDGY